MHCFALTKNFIHLHNFLECKKFQTENRSKFIINDDSTTKFLQEIHLEQKKNARGEKKCEILTNMDVE